MPEFMIKEGVILLDICGVYILCADRNARKECPYTSKLNQTGAIIWQMLKKGYTLEQIICELCNEYETNDTELLKEDINAFIEILVQKHYLVFIAEADDK